MFLTLSAPLLCPPRGQPSAFLLPGQHQYALPFLPLLPAPGVLRAPQERRGSEQAIWCGGVCQRVCSREVTLSNRMMQCVSLQVTDRQGITHVVSLRDWLMSCWKQWKGFKSYDWGGPSASRGGLWNPHPFVNSTLYGDKDGENG